VAGTVSRSATWWSRRRTITAQAALAATIPDRQWGDWKSPRLDRGEAAAALPFGPAAGIVP
jgi:hypothetical protein